MTPDLLARWGADLVALHPGIDPRLGEAAGSQLLSCWNEPHRRYHTTRHLQEVLLALDELLDPARAPVARVAGWFHDAVYDVRQLTGRSEAESARLARAMLGTLGVPGPTVRQVADLVEMTADHVVTTESAVQDAFHDADLWILSAPTARFDAYCRQVREEYAHLDDVTFGRARAAILRDLASRARLYRTARAREAWSARAHANLRRELARLTG